MPEPPAALLPRRDDTAADAGSLEAMGRIGEQPIPASADTPAMPDTEPADN